MKACACVEIEGAAVTVVVMAPSSSTFIGKMPTRKEAAREAKRGKGGTRARQRKGPVPVRSAGAAAAAAAEGLQAAACRTTGRQTALNNSGQH